MVGRNRGASSALVASAKDQRIQTVQITICPAKRRQALLGSNLSRDSRVQEALNNAPEGNSKYSLLFPAYFHHFIQAFLPMP